jgi:hypothetical protein
MVPLPLEPRPAGAGRAFVFLEQALMIEARVNEVHCDEIMTGPDLEAG